MPIAETLNLLRWTLDLAALNLKLPLSMTQAWFMNTELEQEEAPRKPFGLQIMCLPKYFVIGLIKGEKL